MTQWTAQMVNEGGTEMWVGAVWAGVEFVPTRNPDVMCMICVQRPSYRRYIRVNDLLAALNSGQEIQFHDIGWEWKGKRK